MGLPGRGAGSAHWGCLTKPRGADHGPMRTLPTALSTVARMCPGPWRVAPPTSGVVSHGFAVGAAYGLAACGCPIAASEPGDPRRFDRAPLAPHSGGHELGRGRDLRGGGTGQSAAVASWSLCAGAGRYTADDALHVEHAGVGLRRSGRAIGLVPLVG